MEELTKTQLILLALLVSFVTSIATGIATVALMDQAPSDVTRVINRVVERTVEKVVPNEQGASVVTTEKTVIVKEEDALTGAIEDIGLSLVRLYSGNGVSQTFIGMGSVVTADGWIVTDSDAVALGVTYRAEFLDDTAFTAIVIGENAARGIAVLELSSLEGEMSQTFSPVVPTEASIKLGQTVFTVSGQITKIASGIVTKVPQGGSDALIGTNLRTSDFVTGAALGNLFGEVVGIAESTNTENFIPIADVLSVVKAVQVENVAEAGNDSAVE